MNFSRRGFLGAILAAAAAPAIVKSDSLMRIVVPRPVLLTLWGDGVHDDAQAIQALVSGQSVMFGGREFGPRPDGSIFFPSGTFAMGAVAVIGSGAKLFGNGTQLKALTKAPMLELKPGTQDVLIRDFHFVGLGEPAIRIKP
jgi:hypothetical protein